MKCAKLKKPGEKKYPKPDHPQKFTRNPLAASRFDVKKKSSKLK